MTLVAAVAAMTADSTAETSVAVFVSSSPAVVEAGVAVAPGALAAETAGGLSETQTAVVAATDAGALLEGMESAADAAGPVAVEAPDLEELSASVVDAAVVADAVIADAVVAAAVVAALVERGAALP